MKALTISQPFASLITSGEKWVENRTWGTFYRGPLLIHAGKRSDYIAPEELRKFPTGSILAMALLGACLPALALSRALVVPLLRKSIGEILDHPHTEGPWCWILTDILRFAEPIPYAGARGLFDVPDEVVADAIARAELCIVSPISNPQSPVPNPQSLAPSL